MTRRPLVRTPAPARRTPSRTPLVAALAAATLLVAAGCASTASAEAGAPTGEATYAGAEVRFGSPFEYDDGLSLQVKAPAKFTPTAQAEWDRSPGGVPVRIHVTITNGTPGDFTPHTVSASAVSGGQDAVPLLDPGTQIGLTGPGVDVRPGNLVKFDLAFAVQDPDDVTLTLDPAIGGYEPLVLTTD